MGTLQIAMLVYVRVQVCVSVLQMCLSTQIYMILENHWWLH